MTSKPRAMFYAHDGLGLGHFRRLCRIARALREFIAPLLITGHRYADRMVPDGCEYVRLPLVPEGGMEASRAPTGKTNVPFWDMAPESIAVLRREIIDATYRAYAPRIVVVDHLPLGKFAEFRQPLINHDGLSWFIFRGTSEPDEMKRSMLTNTNAKSLRDLYHRIVVTSDPTVCDLSSEPGLPPDLLRKVSYTGYLAEAYSPSEKRQIRRDHGISDTDVWVVCSAGGGWSGARYLAECCRLAYRHPNVRFDVIAGPKGDCRLLQEEAASARCDNLRVHSDCDDLNDLHAASDLALCTGGYNSISEAMAGRTPLIVVPSQARQGDEQYLHAQRLMPFYPVCLVTAIEELDKTLSECLDQLRGLSQRAADSRLRFDGFDALRHLMQQDMEAHLVTKGASA